MKLKNEYFPIINIFIFTGFISFFFQEPVLAYSDFISYGYKSCITCHVSSSGSGLLNDYGKSFFATELVASTFVSEKPDELGESSGFLGKTELPSWLKVGIKYRGLWMRQDVGSQKAVDSWINMQADFDSAILLDEREKNILVLGYSYVPTPRAFATAAASEKPSQWISKVHYFRWLIDRGIYAYFGLFDKFYGIKHPDHTAVNRSKLTLGQNDQTHGAAIHFENDQYGLASHLFLGNLSQEVDLRQKGFSLTGEYFFSPKLTFGASVLSSSNSFKKEFRASVHNRISFVKGKSVLTEVGLKKDDSKTSVIKSEEALYLYNQMMLNLTKGYNFISSYQFYESKLNSNEKTNLDKLSMGILIFPYPRFETRLEIVNSRLSVVESTNNDQWSLLGQVHLSW